MSLFADLPRYVLPSSKIRMTWLSGFLLLSLYVVMLFMRDNKISSVVGYLMVVCLIAVAVRDHVLGKFSGRLELSEILLLCFLVASISGSLFNNSKTVDEIKDGIYIASFFILLPRLVNVPAIVSMVALSTGLVAVVSLGWFFQEWIRLSSYEGSAIRFSIMGDSGNPIKDSVLLAVGLVSFGAFLVRQGCKKAGAALFVVSMLALLYVFESRSLLAGIMLFLGFYILRFYRTELLEWRVLISGVVGLLVIVGIAWASGLLAQLMQRGMSHRPEIWRQAVEALSDCGFLAGCGKETDYLFRGQNPHVHSAYLGVWLNNGVFPFLFCLAFIGSLIREIWHERIIPLFAPALLLTLGGFFFVHDAMIFSFGVRWYSLWVTASLCWAELLYLKHFRGGEKA